MKTNFREKNRLIFFGKLIEVNKKIIGPNRARLLRAAPKPNVIDPPIRARLILQVKPLAIHPRGRPPNLLLVMGESESEVIPFWSFDFTETDICYISFMYL